MKRRLTIALTTLLAGVLLPGAVSTASAQGSREGITVHGHWTIDVRQPDGTLVSHREFENALSPSEGTQLLASTLTRRWVPGEWLVYVGQLEGGDSPCMGVNGPFPCVITESTTSQAIAPRAERNLVVTTEVSSASIFGMKLAGSHTAERPGTIRAVATLLAVCTAPQVCSGAAADQIRRLTTAALGTPIDVVAGQIIQVTVVIGFS